MKVKPKTADGISHKEMLRRMDAAGIEKAFLVATRAGRLGHPACYHLPYEMVAKAVKLHPDRFYGMAGLDPWEGMHGVRELEHAVRDLGFIGAHFYPHWYELAPDHAKWYPYYAKCCELDIPVQMQVGQSKHGMQTLNQCLFGLYSRRLITLEEAMGRSNDQDELRNMIEGRAPAIGEARAR